MNTEIDWNEPMTPEESLKLILGEADERFAKLRAEGAAAYQHAINRANARKSTGPRTAAGKAASSQNRLAHGLCSNRLLVLGETQAQFDAVQAEVRASFTPITAEESLLTNQLAEALWRFNRARRVEAKTFDFLMDLTDKILSRNGTLETDQSPEALLGACFINPTHHKTLATMQRYVTAAERSYRQALKAVQEAIKHRQPQPAVAAEPIVEKPKAAAAGRAALPEIGFEPQFVPNRPENAPAYTDLC